MSRRRYKPSLDRGQTLLLPERVEDYMGENHQVRALDAYVDTLDLASMEFRHTEAGTIAGHPPPRNIQLSRWMFCSCHLKVVSGCSGRDSDSGQGVSASKQGLSDVILPCRTNCICTVDAAVLSCCRSCRFQSVGSSRWFQDQVQSFLRAGREVAIGFRYMEEPALAADYGDCDIGQAGEVFRQMSR